IHFHGYLDTIYDLLLVEGITSEDIRNIKPYVIVELPAVSEFVAGQRTATYKVDQWLAAEGNSEGVSEIWLDRYYEPSDVNKMNYDDLILLPNLSPVDAVAVLKQQERGLIKGTFELRNAPGISNYGYRNLIDFVRFTSPKTAKPEFHVRINQLVRTVPVTTNPDDEGLISAFSDASRPELFRKISMSYGKHLKAGYAYHQNMGEPSGIYTQKRSFALENIDLPYGGLRLDRLVLGNFTASYGQGVIMETTDYFSPRRTGYSFSKQAKGIYSDLTRSTQYVMDGMGVQVSNRLFRGSLFASLHPRDAIINADGSFSSLIVMQPRLPWGANGDTTRIYHKITESVDELTWGGNLSFSPAVNVTVGYTFYESLYDRVLDPQVIETITGGPDDHEPGLDLIGDTNDFDEYSGDAFYGNYMTNSADPEIAAMYGSSGESSLWADAKSFRRVSGFDFRIVAGNMAFQGEYGELSSNTRVLKFGDDPSALVLNAYAQFDNFNFLALYRDYDLEFDNPYQRSFSNYQRYKTTIFEDSFWLEDPIYSYLFSGNPQPQAERGLFLSSRYQFHRSFVGTLNWDTWTRKADEASYYRTVATIEWRPVFNYRIRVRQKWQARGNFDLMHPSPFDSRETRVTLRLRLSNYDQVELLYSNGYTTFSPRPRLTGNPLGGSMIVGDIGKPSSSAGLTVTHNFDNNLAVKVGSILLGADAFLWYFEDTDFRIFSTTSGAIHNWISFRFRPTDNLSIRLKVSQTVENPFTRITEGQSNQGDWVSNPVVNSQATDFRVQIDYGI
ncbi:MAG: hypothetical protein H8D46_00305, partial [FCB group bacterium]|nr:hypothetical protein [FCB group bacterium]